MNLRLRPIRVAALVCAGALLSMAQGAAAGSTVVTVNASTATANGVSLCQDAPTLQMDPQGNLNVVCTPVAASTAFACTFASQFVQSGAASATLTPSCSGTFTPPVTYTWTSLDSPAPALSATTSTTAAPTVTVVGPLTNSTATNLVYRYKLDATDSTATPNVAPGFTGTVTVTPPGSACATTATDGAFVNPQTQIRPDPFLKPGGYVSYSLPVYTPAQVGKIIIIKTTDSSVPSWVAFRIQIAVSKCPGDFAPSQPGCTQDFMSGQATLKPFTAAAEVGATKPPSGTPNYPAAACALATGQQYYVNIRAVAADHTTYSCNSQSVCTMVVGYQGM